MDRGVVVADLESSLDAEHCADLVVQSVKLAEAEYALIELVDRPRGSVDRLIHLRTHGGAPANGVACRVESSCVPVDEGEGLQAVVPVSAVATVASLADPAPRDGRRRPMLTALMREVARRGARVRLVLGFGEVVRWLTRVGAGHVDVAVNPEGGICSRRAPEVDGAGVTGVTTAAIEVLRSR